MTNYEINCPRCGTGNVSRIANYDHFYTTRKNEGDNEDIDWLEKWERFFCAPCDDDFAIRVNETEANNE